MTQKEREARCIRCGQPFDAAALGIFCMGQCAKCWLAVLEEARERPREPRFYDLSADKRCVVCGESDSPPGDTLAAWTSAMIGGWIHETCMFGRAGDEAETKAILNDQRTVDAVRAGREQRDAGTLIPDSSVRPQTQTVANPTLGWFHPGAPGDAVTPAGEVEPTKGAADGEHERAVCEKAGQVGHWLCGYCSGCGRTRSNCFNSGGECWRHGMKRAPAPTPTTPPLPRDMDMDTVESIGRWLSGGVSHYDAPGAVKRDGEILIEIAKNVRAERTEHEARLAGLEKRRDMDQADLTRAWQAHEGLLSDLRATQEKIEKALAVCAEYTRAAYMPSIQRIEDALRGEGRPQERSSE